MQVIANLGFNFYSVRIEHTFFHVSKPQICLMYDVFVFFSLSVSKEKEGLSLYFSPKKCGCHACSVGLYI